MFDRETVIEPELSSAGKRVGGAALIGDRYGDSRKIHDSGRRSVQGREASMRAKSGAGVTHGDGVRAHDS